MDGWSVVDGLVPLDTKMPECLRYSSMSTTIRIPLNTYFEGEKSDYESDESLLMFDCDDLNSDSSSTCNRSPTSFKEHEDFCEAANEVKLIL